MSAEVEAAPFVSVVLPTRNRLEYLRRAIASVLRQTMGDLELLVVDDASTDETPALLAASGDARLRPLRLDTQGGVSRARNTGIRAARGRWVAFLDDDDLWRETKLERQLEALAASGAYWSVTGVVRLREGEADGEPFAPPRARTLDALWQEILFDRATCAIQSLLVETALLRAAGLFEEGSTTPFREDFELLLRLAARAVAAPVAEPLVVVTEHPERSAHGGRDLAAEVGRTFRSVLRHAPDRRSRRLARRRHAQVLSHVASSHAAAGRLGTALGVLWVAFRVDPFGVEIRYRAAGDAVRRALTRARQRGAGSTR